MSFVSGIFQCWWTFFSCTMYPYWVHWCMSNAYNRVSVTIQCATNEIRKNSYAKFSWYMRSKRKRQPILILQIRCSFSVSLAKLFENDDIHGFGFFINTVSIFCSRVRRSHVSCVSSVFLSTEKNLCQQINYVFAVCEQSPMWIIRLAEMLPLFNVHAALWIFCLV